MDEKQIQRIIDDMLAHPEPDSLGVDALTLAIRKVNADWPQGQTGYGAALQKVISAHNEAAYPPRTDAEAGDSPGGTMEKFANMITESDRQMGITTLEATDWGAHRNSLA